MAEYYQREDVAKFIRSYRHSTDVAFHMEEHLEEIHAADVRPVKRGRWKLAAYSGKFGSAKEKWYDQFFDGAFWYCDQCRERARKSNFCPNCGADMREES